MCVPFSLSTSTSISIERRLMIFWSVYRLPCPSGPVPRISPHCQGSDSSLGPRKQACQRMCWQRVVSLPEQFSSPTQVSVQKICTGFQCLIKSVRVISHFYVFTKLKVSLLISSWQLHFIQSEFKGQLPQPYASGPLATQIIPANMNDQNLEEPSRYVSSLDADMFAN